MSFLNFNKKKSSELKTSEEISLEQEEIFNEEKEDMIQGIEELHDTTVKEVMVPRIDVDFISIDTEIDELLEKISESGHSRFPVYSESIDNVTGVLYVKDIVYSICKNKKIEVEKIIRKPYFVPESKRIDSLLREFKRKHLHIAIAIDEYGGVSGIITMEDIIEEIVGDIQDEFDNEREDITSLGNNTYLCDARVKDQLIALLKEEILRQYGADWRANADYGKIINEKHFDRICGLIDPAKLAYGGEADRSACRIQPTILENVGFDDAVMQQEIFGPVLPVLTYENLDEAIRSINDRPRPLALYIFSSDKSAIRRVQQRCRFGGGCVNDVVIHLATSSMGFGGVGESGMGAYHGKTGFETFSHLRSIVDKKTWIDLPMRYQPYRRIFDKLIHMFLR